MSAAGAQDEREAGMQEVTGRITIVQEDRIRLVDETGRGYLLVVRRRAASLADLERWRDTAARVRVRYAGLPDAGAVAHRIEPARRAAGRAR